MDKTSLYRSFVANDNLIANYLAKKSSSKIGKDYFIKRENISSSDSNIKNISNKVIIDDNKQTSINDQWTQFQTRKFQIILNTT